MSVTHGFATLLFGASCAEAERRGGAGRAVMRGGVTRGGTAASDRGRGGVASVGPRGDAIPVTTYAQCISVGLRSAYAACRTERPLCIPASTAACIDQPTL